MILNIFRKVQVDLTESKRGPKFGLKKKGRLPAKKIKNKAGKMQTVYYRPDGKTQSKYIAPHKQTVSEVAKQYSESFKRMLFLDHNKTSKHSQVRGRDDGEHAQGAEMIERLNHFADKHGFTIDNFDSKFADMVKNRKSLDGFMQEAKFIYNRMYHSPGQPALMVNFLSKIFSTTSKAIHTKGLNGDALKRALEKNGIDSFLDVGFGKGVADPAQEKLQERRKQIIRDNFKRWASRGARAYDDNKKKNANKPTNTPGGATSANNNNPRPAANFVLNALKFNNDLNL